MAYIGRGTDKISNIEVLDNITFDGSSSYSITKSSVAFVPNSAQSCLISIDGVVQATNFTVSTSTIDFGVAIAGTSTCDFFLHYGTGLITTVSDGTVTTAKLGDASVTSAKINYPLTTFSSTGIDDNATSTAITIDSSENVTMSGNLEVDTIEPQSGTTLTLGASGDTVTLAAGASQSGFPLLGVGQSWTNVAASRAAGTTYTNSTGKPISVAIIVSPIVGAATSVYLSVDGLRIQQHTDTDNGYQVSLQAIVPNGSTYLYTQQSTVSPINYWHELR